MEVPLSELSLEHDTEDQDHTHQMDETTRAVSEKNKSFVEEESPVAYDFASLPKSMYLRASLEPPVEEPARGATSVSAMLQLKHATRERLRQQRREKQREKGRTDMFTNPEKYLVAATARSGNNEENDSASATVTEEMLFLESFCAASHKLDNASVKQSDPVSDRGSSVSPRKGANIPSQPPDDGVSSGCDPLTPQKKKKKPAVKFIPPTPKPFPAIHSRPKSPTKTKPQPEELKFFLPAQQMPSPRMLAASPRLLAAMTFFQKETIDEFGYSSYSDNDEDEADAEHIRVSKQLEREARRRQHEEAEYRSYLKYRETLSTDELQIQLPQKQYKESWLRAKKAHEKLIPKESNAETIKMAALKEEWQKLEAEKKTNEVTIIPRGTGKYILEAMFGKEQRRGRKKRRVVNKADSLHVNSANAAAPISKQKKEDVFIPLDAFKDYKYGSPKVEHAGDLVEVVSLPASFQGSTPPPSPRSQHLHNTTGRIKKKKKKKKDKSQIEEEQKKLRQVNEEYMRSKKKQREQLMLDFSKINQNIQPRVR